MAPKFLKNFNRKHLLFGLYTGGIITVCVFMVLRIDVLNRFQQYGYLGLLIMTVLTTFSWPLPLPYMIVIFTPGRYPEPDFWSGLPAEPGWASAASSFTPSGAAVAVSSPRLQRPISTRNNYPSKLSGVSETYQGAASYQFRQTARRPRHLHHVDGP